MKLRVAYLVSRFPKVSETFIVDEILALEGQGADVCVYTLARGNETFTHSDARGLATRSVWLPIPSARWAGAFGHWVLRRPRVLAALWGQTLARHIASPRALVRAVVALAHAMVFAMQMRREGIEHVHAHWATHTALAAWAIRRLAGISYSFTAHADDIFVRRPMLAEKVREAEFVVTISEYNRRFLAERLGSWASDKVQIVHCGVETEAFSAVPPAPADGPFRIASVARLEAKKGHRHLLDACFELSRRGVDYRCLLLGEGAERSALEGQIRRLGLGDPVQLLGAQPRERVREVLAAAHVVALPCVVLESGRADGIPVALMEALAMQRPVVSSAVSGVPELVEHDRTGLLIEPGDPRAFADALERLRSDPALAARLAAAGRERVLAEFDVQRNAERLHELFATVARRHPAAEAALHDGETQEALS